MIKLAAFWLFLAGVTIGYADTLTLENQTSYPNQKSKIAIQWAATAKEVDEDNKALLGGAKVNPNTLSPLAQQGKVNVAIPKKAEYFRVVAWSQGDGNPDLHTNWVDVVPNKTYTLQADHLVPLVLMSGSGC